MSVWNQIKDKLSVENVLEDYVQLKSKGVNYTCICPFHREKSPSLIVSVEKQIWHCFGCGAGGDIFAFVSLIENLDKSEVLKKLAKKAGVQLQTAHDFNNKNNSNIDTNNDTNTINKDNSSKSNEKKKYLMLEWVASIYHNNLLLELEKKDSEIAKYCLERGLTFEIIKKFRLGLSGTSSVFSRLENGDREKYTLLKELGLVLD